MTTQMIIRIDSEKREKLKRLSKTEGKPVSEIIRELIDSYIQERDMGDYIDDLWKRTGNIIMKKGHSLKDVAAAVQESRKARYRASSH